MVVRGSIGAGSVWFYRGRFCVVLKGQVLCGSIGTGSIGTGSVWFYRGRFCVVLCGSIGAGSVWFCVVI